MNIFPFLYYKNKKEKEFIQEQLQIEIFEHSEENIKEKVDEELKDIIIIQL